MNVGGGDTMIGCKGYQEQFDWSMTCFKTLYEQRLDGVNGGLTIAVGFPS